jgi:paraquat-inducible protein A
MLWVLVPLRAGTRPLAFVPVMRALTVLRPWRMVEVFLLGVIVAIVKLTNIATATPGWGLFGVATATIALAALGTVDRDALWRRAREAA